MQKRVVLCIISALMLSNLHAQNQDVMGNKPRINNEVQQIHEVVASANYYVSPNGNVTTGTSAATAWDEHSFQEAINNGTIQNGDTIAFERGCVYSANFTFSKAVTITDYGIGEKPIFSGTQPLTGFTYQGNNVYSVPVNASTISLLLLDGVLTRKVAVSLNDNITLSAVSGLDFTHASFAGHNYVDAEIVLRTSNWSIEVCNIVAHVGSTISIDNYNTYTPTLYTEFFVQNASDLLVANGNWAVLSDTLYIYSSTNIASHTVEVPLYDVAITVSVNTGTVRLSNIAFKGYSHTGITTTANARVVVENCFFKNQSTGIYTKKNKAAYFSVSNSNFENLIGDGVSIWGRPDTVIVQNNTFKNIGNLGEGLGDADIKYRYSAIECGAVKYYLVDGNTVKEVGYNGISGGSHDATIMSRNYVENTNLLLVDGAGMYVPPGNAIHYATVSNNIVINGERGIYSDYGNDYIDITNNTMVACSYSGWYGNDNQHTYVRGNTIYNCGQGLRPQQYGDSIKHDYPLDLNIYNNVVCASSGYAFQYGIGSVSVNSLNWSDIGFGSLHNNVYVLSGNNNQFRIVHGTIRGFANSNSPLKLSQMQTLGFETNSELIIQASPELVRNETANDKVIDFTGFTKTTARGIVYSNFIRLLPFTSVVFVNSEVN